MALLDFASWHAGERTQAAGKLRGLPNMGVLGHRYPLRVGGAPAESPSGLPALADAVQLDQQFIRSFPAEGPLDSFVKDNDMAGDNDEVAGNSGSEVSGDSSVASSGGAGGDDGVEEASNACNDVHPNADSPDMVHVVFASDTSQVEGVQASVASVVGSAASPEELTVHIMVQDKMVAEFKEKLGLRPECQGTVTVTGVLVRVHSVDAQLIAKAVAKVSKGLLKERGAIDTVENFARFYMHLVFDFEVAIYLDADTIVQADLGQLRKQLKESGKTVGFVSREDKSVKMDKFLKGKPKNCNVRLKNWKKLNKLPAYNVGVFAVNLWLWKKNGAVERVEDLVSQHNNCGGKLWIGGSQPPLLLAFLDHPDDVPDDYIVFDAGWNAGDLGWRTNMNEAKLKKKFVLHWNGNQKPWKTDGLYKELWRPHRERFSSVMRAFESDGGSTADNNGKSTGEKAEKKSKKKKVKTTTTMSPEEISAHAACPSVNLMDEWPEAKPCKIGKTYGCGPNAGKEMWTKDGCAGVFNVSGKVTLCGSENDAMCQRGDLPQPKHSCGLMLLTTYFTMKKDWQRGKFAKVSFGKIQKLYQTALRAGLSVTVIYDSLPEEFLQRYTCERFQFAQVNLDDFDRRYGVNDVRYFFFDRIAREHPEWKAMFIVDAFDVRVALNPCPELKDGMLYVGIEQDRLKRHPWMQARFKKMGGKYNIWYNNQVKDKMKILNCGITGGKRDVMLKLMRRQTEVLQDPTLSVRQKKEDINLNMASLNYIVYNEFNGRFTGNAPVHSVYKRFETKRKDVWFIHK